MPDDKTDLGKPKIEIKPAAKRNLLASPRRVVRPTSATMLEEIRQQSLRWAEIRRIQQLQTMIPKTELAAIKIADKADRITKAYAMSKAIAKAKREAKHAEAMAAAASFRNMIEMSKASTLLAAWKDQQALWKRQTALLREFRIIDMPHFVGWFPDSEPVAIVRGVVYGLRDDKAAGDGLEKIVGDNLSAKLHKQLGIEVLKTDKNLHLHLGNENGEIDFVAYCEGNVIFLVEVKKTIDKKKIIHFLNKNTRLFIESRDTLSNEKIFGLIAYADSRSDAVSFAKKRGLLVCMIAESDLVLADPPNLQQLCDLRSTNLDKPKTPQKHRKKKLDKPDTPHEWISYQKNGDETAPSFKVTSRPTKSCRNYLKKFLNKYEGYRWFFPSRSIAEDAAGGCIMPLERFVTDDLLGWKNIIVFDDKIIPFSVENAKKLFRDLPDLYDDLVLRTYKVWHNNSAEAV